ncbi:hypothetical protein AX15_007108 [Amanita polypyramis BW_CC]|nr:hypothetical protein AX15_007108 [Amanita polypyramis BW_CC]
MRAGAVSSLPNVDTSSWASCARADMKTIDREAQMKYDIAKNEDGPLKRTMKAAETRTSDQLIEKVKSLAAFPAGTEEDVVMSLTPERHPGFDERLSNIEKHLAVRYVPSPPKFFLDRLEFLEDHLVQLERDYPPWAALHFNQPNRGWPPPPRSTPIIVPPYMRAVSSSTTAVPTSAAAGPSTSGSMPHHTSTPGGSEPSQLMGGQRTRSTTSSLQKAVLEKLEVYQAMNDLANGGSSAGAGRSGVSGT